MENYLLQMKNINKSFDGVKALSNVSINVRKGTAHALVGENGAGKSTLMNCLLGITKMDSGDIIFNGKKSDIAMVHQELQPILEKNIAENIFCGRYPLKKWGPLSIIDLKKMYDEAQKYLNIVGLNISAKTLMKELSISQMQLVEIAKAISTNAKLIIFDEPTSSLTDNETNLLFNIINKLKKDGITFIYISHKINEILEISDEVSILRDGTYIGTYDTKELDINSIIKHMVGRELNNLYPKKENKIGDVVLKIENFNSKDFNNVNFCLHTGEILGIGGLVGAKRTELMESIFGIRKIESGKIYFKNNEIKIKNSKDAIKNGIAYLSEDRRKTGIFDVLSITDNIGIVAIDKYLLKSFIIDYNKLKEEVNKNIKDLNIKVSDKDAAIKNLSGGNQQKVLFARWFNNTPEILILDEPTRGIDVGSKYEIYTIINELAKNGKSIILVSSEMQELIGLSDRIITMHEGHITGELNKDEATQEKIMSLISLRKPLISRPKI